MKGYLVLYVFIISISNTVKSSVVKECLKNILGECLQPLVKHHKVKTTRSIAATENECDQYGNCVIKSSAKESLRSQKNYMFEEDNSTQNYEEVNWQVLCKIQPNGWNCGDQGYSYTFYYDIKLYGCKSAKIGTACQHNHNSFNTLEDCTTMCDANYTNYKHKKQFENSSRTFACRYLLMYDYGTPLNPPYDVRYNFGLDDGEHEISRFNLPPPVLCRLQPDFGYCDGYYPSFYFDLTTRRCVGFSYSGCGGNSNRFATAQICASACSTQVDFDPE